MIEYKPQFAVGEVVIYRNGDSYELGVIKKIIQTEQRTYLKQQGFPPKGEPDGEVVTTYDYFVNYHTGDTAARTPEDCLHKIVNSYAFEISRLTNED
jgi:hypothetical protein